MKNEFDTLIDLVESPTELAQQERSKLKNLLVLDPSDIPSRLKLLGHSYFIEENSDWQEHFSWFVENRPTDRMLVRIGHLIMEALHPSYYDEVKDRWLKKMAEQESSAWIFANAAASIMLSEPSLASQYLDRAIALEPHEHEFEKLKKYVEHVRKVL